jgi:hypothetical protein
VAPVGKLRVVAAARPGDAEEVLPEHDSGYDPPDQESGGRRRPRRHPDRHRKTDARCRRFPGQCGDVARSVGVWAAW